MNAKLMKSSSALVLTMMLLSPASAYADSYLVKQGDTLTKIAKQYNTTISTLMNRNQLTSDRLSIGQALVIDSSNLPSQTVASLSTADVTPASSELAQLSATEPATQLLSQPASEPAAEPASLAASQPETQTDSNDAMVAADILNVREQPSLDSTIIAKLHYGAKIAVVEKGEEWTKVLVDGKEAYVASEYLTSPAKIQIPDLPEDADAWSKQLSAVIEPLLNTPYRYGGNTTDGFDCSGFTAYVYRQFGITLPRTSEEQFYVGEEVSFDEAMPGDLLFYDALKKGKVSHVAMYVGNGMIVHANGTNVRFEKEVYMHNLYPFYGVKRIVSRNDVKN